MSHAVCHAGFLPRLLLLFLIVVDLLSFFLAPSAQVAILAPLAIGIVTSLGVSTAE